MTVYSENVEKAHQISANSNKDVDIVDKKMFINISDSLEP